MKLIPALLIFASLSISCSSVHAEMSPESYANFQAAAPNAFTIEVQEVVTSRRQCGNDACINVKANVAVTGVARTSAKVQAGQWIKICYQHTERAVALIGPSEIPILKAGRKSDAFLKWDPKQHAFVPAAGGYSFQKVDARPTVEKKT